MMAIDTKEKLNLLVEGLENGEIIVDGRNMTEKDHEELAREIAEYKALRKAKEVPVFA